MPGQEKGAIKSDGDEAHFSLSRYNGEIHSYSSRDLGAGRVSTLSDVVDDGTSSSRDAGAGCASSLLDDVEVVWHYTPAGAYLHTSRD